MNRNKLFFRKQHLKNLNLYLIVICQTTFYAAVSPLQIFLWIVLMFKFTTNTMPACLVCVSFCGIRKSLYQPGKCASKKFTE